MAKKKKKKKKENENEKKRVSPPEIDQMTKKNLNFLNCIELKIKQWLRERAKWACGFRVSSHPVHMCNATGSSREPNPSHRICHLRAVSEAE